MSDALVALLVLLGVTLVLVASLGILRLPDLYTRMHASTKPASLGVSTLVVALALHAGELGIAMRGLAIALFFLLTAPVAAHRLGRAAYRAGVPLWSGTVRDELREREDAPGSSSPARRPAGPPTR